MTSNGVLAARRTSDALGRVTQYTEYQADGVTAKFSRASSYDNDNRAVSDTTNTVASGVTTTVTTSYDYRLWNGTSYAGADQGSVTHTASDQVASNAPTVHVTRDTKSYGDKLR